MTKYLKLNNIMPFLGNVKMSRNAYILFKKYVSLEIVGATRDIHLKWGVHKCSRKWGGMRDRRSH